MPRGCDRNYYSFLADKTKVLEASGFNIDKDDLNPKLYEFQKDIVHWALYKGRAAIFADCGLGKTAMQLEWAYQVHKYTNKPVLILAPLAVADQTQREGLFFDVEVKICTCDDDVINGVNITNYDKLERFNCSVFSGIALDESSILKSFSSKLKEQIIAYFKSTPYKLACTATPSPNDYMELSNHSEFLGVMSRAEMLSMYFVHDGGDTSKWRLKGHAEDVFWQWMATWSVMIANPKDLGYEDMGYTLPQLNIHQIVVDGLEPTNEALSLTERRNARKESLDDRVKAAAELVNNSNEQWLVWCDLNDESAKLHQAINDSVEVKGSDKPQHKSSAMLNFSNEEVKCLVTKPSIAGFGMNWQQCHNMIFVGLSDSYEQYYQAVRRCYRFGQEKEVNVYIIISSKEGCVKDNIERKQNDYDNMKEIMTKLCKEITRKELQKTARISTPYNPTVKMILPNWEEMR